jgi:catechol 2,3-dioxygenase-like lactoylglutathione lyase family enzyme
MIDVNGIAHIALSVKSIAKSKIFYKELMPFLGLKLVHEGKKSIYHVGARTGILIQEIDKEIDSSNFNQNNIGLHHFCFRARNKEDINMLKDKLTEINAKIIRGPLDGAWAPGYYYILFEDPDGIKIEVNYVPGSGVLAKNAKLNPNNDYL